MCGTVYYDENLHDFEVSEQILRKKEHTSLSEIHNKTVSTKYILSDYV